MQSMATSGRVIASPKWSKSNQDADQDAVARWIADEGRFHGFRAAPPMERAKAVGLWFYMADLPL